MDKIIESINSLEWWFSTVFVALIVSYLYEALKRYVPTTLGFIFKPTFVIFTFSLAYIVTVLLSYQYVDVSIMSLTSQRSSFESTAAFLTQGFVIGFLPIWIYISSPNQDINKHILSLFIIVFHVLFASLIMYSKEDLKLLVTVYFAIAPLLGIMFFTSIPISYLIINLLKFGRSLKTQAGSVI